jgi:tetratricopeptide (TPR) repeat protein
MAHVIVTSNAPDWRSVAAPVEIGVWPSGVGAVFLIERTGLADERAAALALSDALAGLPLAHEQAAAYCERLGVGLATYASRFAEAPAKFLGDERGAPRQYHNGLTVSKTFALAIEEAAKLNPAAEPLIVYAALLAPEAIPLYLFSNGREQFPEPFKSLIRDDGIDEAIAALRAFSLIDRETIEDERDSSITTDCVRLHRLVRTVATMRRSADECAKLQRILIKATNTSFPLNAHEDPKTWPIARRLDAIALALVDEQASSSEEAAHDTVRILSKLGMYRQGALGATDAARKFHEQELTIREKIDGPAHPDTARCLHNIGYLYRKQGDFEGARRLYLRALEIIKKELGLDHQHTATALNNLGSLSLEQHKLAEAQSYHQQALKIRKKILGPSHRDTASSFNNLGNVYKRQGVLKKAQNHFEGALKIYQRILDPNDPATATVLNNIGSVLKERGDLQGAKSYFERSLSMRQQVLGLDHPETAITLNNLGTTFANLGDSATALECCERGLNICETKLGVRHPTTLRLAVNMAALLDLVGNESEAAAMRQKFGLEQEQ